MEDQAAQDNEKILYTNTTQVANYLLDNLHLFNEGALKIALLVTRKTIGWHKETIPLRQAEIMEKTGLAKATVHAAINFLMEAGVIVRVDDNGKELQKSVQGRRQEIYYLLNQKLTKDQLVQNLNKLDLFKKRTSKGSKFEQVPPITPSRDIYKTQVKTQGKSIPPSNKTLHGEEFKKLSGRWERCPVNRDDFSLKAKYPKGHDECDEFVRSIENSRRRGFANRNQQLFWLHDLLAAGFDFEEIDRIIELVEKKYGTNNWDFERIIKWADKEDPNTLKPKRPRITWDEEGYFEEKEDTARAKFP